MITKFKLFENIDMGIELYDRVICHGSISFWYDDGSDNAINITIDVEGQTGIVVKSSPRYKSKGILFDNYFTPFFDDLDRATKFKRGLWVTADKIELVHRFDENPMKFSDNAKKILDHCEIIDCVSPVIIDYIDLTDKNDMISFMPLDRMNRLNGADVWNNNLRFEMKIGKFILMINPNTDQISLNKKIDLFKSAFNSIISNKFEFKIVKGADILKWYDERKYQDGNGSLNKSCMRNRPDRLDLYVDNPDKVSMLILVNDENKLVGRAIIWKVDSPDVTYMDRCYVVYQEDQHRFEDYANKHSFLKYPLGPKIMIIYFDSYQGDSYAVPYMDTFCFFYISGKNGENYLTNIAEEKGKYLEYTWA